MASSRRVFGTLPVNQTDEPYSEDSSAWFDMGLNSKYGLAWANRQKLTNRRSYQEIIFKCLGSKFSGQPYLLPDFSATESDLRGDIALAPNAGHRWPMKNWPHYEALADRLSQRYVVNVLPVRDNVLEHISDISQHRLLVTGDSLPMHLALALRIPTMAFFTCTSPWEIYDYGVLRKLISSRLPEFFYDTGYHQAVFESLPLSMVEQQIHALMGGRLKAQNGPLR